MLALLLLHVGSALLFWNEAGPAFGLEYWQISIFDLDEEESFGTWFSAMLLMGASVLLWVQARRRREAGDAWHRGWWWLGLGFAGLSLDEVAGIHEFVATQWESTPWTYFGAAVAASVAVAFTPFLLQLPPRARALFVVAGAIYLGGALGVERATDVFDTAAGLNTLEYNLWNAVEEGLEMGGVILFLYALIGHMQGANARTPADRLEAEGALSHGGEAGA